MQETGPTRRVPHNVDGKVAVATIPATTGTGAHSLVAPCGAAQRVDARPPVDHLPLGDPRGSRAP
jgi:hypothetical protein